MPDDAPASSAMGKTLAFNAAPAQAPDPIPQTTQAFGAFPAQGTTRAFGAAPESPSQPQERTQAFGAVPSPEEPVGRTTLFGAQPGASSQDTGLRLPPESPAPVGSETLLPFGPGQVQAPVSATGSRRAPVELPPELLAASRESSLGTSAEPSGLSFRKVLPVLAVVAGLILTGVLAYPAWRDRDSDMPAAAVEDKDRAALLLLRDDPASRDQAIQRLRALISNHPRYIEAQAELVVALSLRLADLQLQAGLIQEREVRLKTAIETYSGTNRAAATRQLQQELDALARDGAALQPAMTALRKELLPLVTSLVNAPETEPVPALVARMKARAFHAGVTAAPDALALAERLRKMEGSPKTWSTLSRAEYALNSGSPPASLQEVGKELDGLRRQESSLRRAYVLGARVALRLDDPATARSLLDDAVALNPNHELARKLLSQLGGAGTP
jgi:hypothetical protein